MKANFDAMDKVLGTSKMSSFADIFDKMEIAGEEVESARKRWPNASDEIDQAFMILVPSQFMGERPSNNVYRAYCRELLDRVANHKNLDEPTAAEMVMVFYNTSLFAPLVNDEAGAYKMLFDECFPDSKIDVEVHPSCKGAFEERIESTRKIFRDSKGKYPKRST